VVKIDAVGLGRWEVLYDQDNLEDDQAYRDASSLPDLGYFVAWADIGMEPVDWP
jgi:hypothetical protein